MSRRAAAFRQSDVSRALKAAKAAGVEARVEIDRRGVISIIPQAAKAPAKGNEWDEVLDPRQA
jgi:hypothetical protein